MKTPKGDERGAVKIKTVLILTLLLITGIVVVKFIPAYKTRIDITHDVDELARKAAVRGYNKDKINKGIEELMTAYGMQQGEISVTSAEQGQVSIVVNHTIQIDFWITTYDLPLQYTATGKEF